MNRTQRRLLEEQERRAAEQERSRAEEAQRRAEEEAPLNEAMRQMSLANEVKNNSLPVLQTVVFDKYKKKYQLPVSNATIENTCNKASSGEKWNLKPLKYQKFLADFFWNRSSVIRWAQVLHRRF